nr:MAG TPA: hypothetical protein [Caudoviricetes sp.]
MILGPKGESLWDSPFLSVDQIFFAVRLTKRRCYVPIADRSQLF